MEKTKKPIFKKWWFWVIIIVMIAVIASMGKGKDSDKAGGTADTEKNGVATTVAGTTTEAKTEYETVDIQQMLDDLKNNAMKAEQTYQNKHVEITGKIAGFDSDGRYITIEPVNADEWNFETIMCYIKKDEHKQVLMEKSKGDTVVIKGKVKSIGEVLGYSVDIDEIS